MAGGILIAILVIGALLLMINQIGSYEKAQTSNVKDSQLAQFNYDFERYTEKQIKGIDNLGKKTFEEIKKKLAEYNIELKKQLEN